MISRRLIIFTRFPEPYKAKTRLIPALGAEGAARLHRELTCHTLACVRELARNFPVATAVRFEGGTSERMAAIFGNSFPYRRQGEGDLGRRLDRAFAEAFSGGAQRVIIVGIDCPEMTPQLVREAFDSLAEHDIVLRPAADGGYYSIGLRFQVSQLFTEISWGTEAVLTETLREARQLSLKVYQLKTLSDVDRPEDLAIWYRVRASSQTNATPPISVIVPTLNESADLPIYWQA
ncbi:TIGR04282 family arsenosugar biosynthesis glycosyltransferase [Thermogutta sp.]|uniref:TIGR04282 family arsenosugar biosynthesis glycosyltransferase n=1 Tax=Thermogutta sp. TaxID=1962930 RepID=UPI0032208958